MPDGRGGWGSESKSKVLRACENSFAANFADCSGFLRAVLKELGIPKLEGSAHNGSANDVYDALFTGSSDWDKIGIGNSVASIAGMTADEEKLVVAALEEPCRGRKRACSSSRC